MGPLLVLVLLVCSCGDRGVGERDGDRGGVADYDDNVDADCGAGYVGVAGA